MSWMEKLAQTLTRKRNLRRKFCAVACPAEMVCVLLGQRTKLGGCELDLEDLRAAVHDLFFTFCFASVEPEF